jgi:DNA polymerase I-like protein with 3'-5' exonuclease and polymerase domains
MTLDEMKALPKEEQDALFSKIDAARKVGKSTNYAATYGAGPPTIARSAGVSEREGGVLHKAYWDLNWSIPAVAASIETKTLDDGSMWLLNPVSGFWYSLRHEKDIWSTLNQGTGVYCFDKWVENFRKKRPQLTGQMHDECILTVKKGHRAACTKLLKDAVQLVNEQLKLNRDLDVDVAYGDDYSAIH